MKLLYGPLAAEGLQPFDRCIVADWHIASDGRVTRHRDNPQIVSYELTQAGHRLQSHVLPQLPPGWQPDLALFALPERYALPLDLHSLPCPLAVLVEDWYFNFEMLTELGPLFDYWIVDKTAVPLLQQAGIEQVCAFPVFALKLERFAAEASGPILYDIGFIGNLRTAVHTRRAHYLARIAALSPRWRIGIATERYGTDYTRFFRQCRMIFNYSIHGEFNMRCYEALACGRLMLLEATNQETPDYLTPGQDYVSYTPETLESTIAYYLEHDQERETIAAQGQRSISRYGAEQMWQQLRERLAAGLATGEIRVQPGRRTSLAGRLANLVWSVGPPFDQLTVAGDVLQRQPVPEPRRLSDLAVLYYTFWLSESAPPSSPALGEALGLLERARALAPRHPLAAYNLGQIRALQRRPDEALAAFKQAIAQLEAPETDWFWGLSAYPGLHLAFEKFYHPWFMRQSHLQYALATNPAALRAARRNLLLAHACRHAGDLLLEQGQSEQALTHWEKALRLGRGGLRDLLPNLMRLCLDLRQPRRALAAWAGGLGDPLASELWLLHCWALAAAAQPLAAKAWYWRYSCIKEGLKVETNWQQLFQSFTEPPDQQAPAAWQAALLPLLPPELHPTLAETEAWLFAWCGLHWRPGVPEPAPDFGGLLGVDPQSGSHFHYSLEVNEAKSDHPAQLERVYDARSDLAQGRIGVDLLPCSFPTDAPETFAELDELSGPLWLMLLDTDWQLPLAELEALANRQNPPTVALWQPGGLPDEARNEALADQLAHLETLDLLLLPQLNPGEQRALLSRADRIWLRPRGWQAYYLWWALELGTALELPPGSLETLLAIRGEARQTASEQAERAAWILRAWMVKQHCLGELWTSATPHLDASY